MSLAATYRAWRAGRASTGLRGMELNRATLTLLAAAWLAVPGNLPLWRAVWHALDGPRGDNILFVLSLPLFVLAWIYLLLSLVTWGRATKPILCAVLLVSAAVGYFMQTYGVLPDPGMVTNILQTDLAETLDLMSWRLWGWVLAFGVVPALLVALAPVTSRPWPRELGIKALGMTLAAACLAAVLLAQYQHYASLVRNHRELRLMVVPHNVVAAVHGYLKRHLAAPVTVQVVGADATRAVPAARTARPVLTVLVIGETARAANFSLNGYPRTTNPELARERIVSYSEATACGTSTAVSLPCMFMDVGRAGFDEALAERRESLLDVLQRAGIQVLWRDNNSGCKGVCNRVPHEDMSVQQVPGLCRDGECFDEILLHGMQDYLDGLDGDALIVLHMKGSHGPAYFKRYPPAYEAFKPVCSTIQLDRCSRESIVNAYDNTLRYTDHVLSRTIALLQSNARRFDTALLYVSDHGESLGERGLYLHGIPYALAPREQIAVPMLLWMSQEMESRLGIDAACLEARRNDPVSHDNLFHSVLGLSSVRTAIYRPERDLFRQCRSILTAGHGGTG